MSIRLTRGLVLCTLALQGLVAIVPTAMAQTAPSTPVIFNHTLSAKPGDVVALQGANFGSAPVAWLLDPNGQMQRTLEIVSRPGTNALNVRVPADAGNGALLVAVHNGNTLSTAARLNGAMAYTLDATEIVPGGRFRLVGRNLVSPGYTPQVTVGGLPATVDLAGSDAYMLKITAPAGLTAAANTTVVVDNGNGSGASTLARPVAVRAIATADPFGLGLGWTAAYAPLLNRVVNPANASDPLMTGYAPARCDGVTNDYAAIQHAILALGASGGTVQLPSGNCRSSTAIELISNVVLQGVDPDHTTLSFEQHEGAIYSANAGTQTVAVRNMTIRPTGNAGSGLYFNQQKRVVIQNVRFTHDAGGFPVNVVSSENVAIAGSEFHGLVRVVGIKGFAITDNTVDFAVAGAFGLDASTDGLMLNNHGTRISHAGPRTDVQHVVTANYSSRILMRSNLFDVTGAPIEYVYNDGETILNEGGGPGQTANIGTVTSATANTLTDANSTLNFNKYANLQPSDAALTFWNQVVEIASGKGAGQIRYITGYNPASRTMMVDRPWDVIPDGSSHYSAFVMGLEKTIIQSNHLVGNPRGIQLYTGGSRDVDIVDNLLTNNGSIYISGGQDYTNNRQLFYPAINILVQGNVFEQPKDPYPAAIQVLGSQWYGDTFGTGLINVVVRDNQIAAHQPNLVSEPEGYSSLLKAWPASININNGIPQILGTIFQRNTCTHCEVAYRLNTGNYGVVIDTPVQNQSGSLVLRSQEIGARNADGSPMLDTGTAWRSVPSSVNLSASAGTVEAGQPLDLAVTVSGAKPGGTVQFWDGSTPLGSAITLDAQGQARLSTTALAATGIHTLSASYAGDTVNQAGQSAALTLTVIAPPAGGSGSAPVIVNRSLTVQAGDVISVQGERLGSNPTVWLAATATTPERQLATVNGLEATNGAISVRLPSDAAYPMSIRVYNGTAWSQAVPLNQAQAYHLDALEIVPGGRMRIVGRNLLTPGFTPHLSVGGMDASIDLAASNDNLLAATAPTGLTADSNTQLAVDNGNGSGPSTLDRALTVNDIPAADPFGLGVGWTAIFQPMLDTVIDPSNTGDYRMLLSGAPQSTAFAKCDGVTDDQAAIQQAIIYVSRVGGGVVQLPAGTCRIGQSLELLRGVILQGQGKDQTIIRHDQAAAYTADDTIAVRNLSFQQGSPGNTMPFAAVSHNRLVLQNVRFSTELQGERSVIDANRNVVVAGSDWVGQLVVKAAGFAFENNTLSHQKGVGLDLSRSRDGLVQNNQLRRTVTAETRAATARPLVLQAVSRVALLNNNVDATGPALDNTQRNQEALLSSAQYAGGLGTVQSATPMSLTDANMALQTSPYGTDTNPDGTFGLPDNYAVAIVAGKGMGQLRHIRAYDAAAHKLYVDQAWTVVPDTSSRYSTYVPGLERAIVRNNAFSNLPGGINLSDAGVDQVDIIGNHLKNTNGINVTSRQSTPDQQFRPVYNLMVADNQLDAAETGYPQSVNISHSQGSTDTPFGVGMIGAVVKGQRVVETKPLVSLSGMRNDGFSSLVYTPGPAQPGHHQMLGTIFERNACDHCDVAYRFSGGLFGAVIDAPAPIDAGLQLRQQSINGSMPSGSQVDVNTVISGLPTATALSVSGANLPAGSLVLTATVTSRMPGYAPPSSGSVQFMDGAVKLSTPVPLGSNSKASLMLSNVQPGAHSFRATYLGDTSNGPSTSSPAQ